MEVLKVLVVVMVVMLEVVGVEVVVVVVIEVDTKERNPVCLIAIIASSGTTSPLLTSGIKDSNRWADFIFSPLSS